MVWAGVGLAALLLGSLFGLGRFGPLDFFYSLAACGVVLTAWALADRKLRSELAGDVISRPVGKILLGLAGAAVLYLVFFLGNLLLRALFSGAGAGVSAVYQLGEGAAPGRVALLLVVIGVAEEIFWRGFVLRRLLARHRELAALLLATAAYTAVHLASGNPVLLLAAAVCGGFWGLMYLWRRSLLACLVSHVAWDIAVFVLWPL